MINNENIFQIIPLFILFKISQANQELNSTLSNAVVIGEMAKIAKIQSQNILNESYSLIERHEKFLNPTGVQSTDIAMKVDEVLSS